MQYANGNQTVKNSVRAKLAELDKEQRIGLYQRVFSSIEGQLVLEDLRERGFYYVTTFMPGETELREGMRAFLLHIDTYLNTELEPFAFPKPEGDIDNV